MANSSAGTSSLGSFSSVWTFTQTRESSAPSHPAASSSYLFRSLVAQQVRNSPNLGWLGRRYSHCTLRAWVGHRLRLLLPRRVPHRRGLRDGRARWACSPATTSIVSSLSPAEALTTSASPPSPSPTTASPFFSPPAPAASSCGTPRPAASASATASSLHGTPPSPPTAASSPRAAPRATARTCGR